MGRVAVSKTGQKTASPRGDGSGVPVGRGAVPKIGRLSARDRFCTGSRQSCHAGLALKYLWVGSPCQRPVRRTLSHAITCIRWALPASRVRGSIHLSESSAAIDLREIHLAPQSSLQVPVGHIPVPGGIKLCSPGTFLVANYLIINNSSCQVNFTKPNSATIRYANSQWLRVDATKAPVGGGAVPKTGRNAPSSRIDTSGVPVGKGAVPKSGRSIGQRPV